MNPPRLCLLAVLAGPLLLSSSLLAGMVFEVTSAYHHIRVVNDGGLRTLRFDDADETTCEFISFDAIAGLW